MSCDHGFTIIYVAHKCALIIIINFDKHVLFFFIFGKFLGMSHV